MTVAHGDSGSIRGRREREGSKGSQHCDEHELRGEENHVGKVGIDVK